MSICLIHRYGCGKPAFMFVRMPRPEDYLSDRENIRHIDGSQIISTDPIACDSCGQLLGRDEVRLRYVEIGRAMQ